MAERPRLKPHRVLADGSMAGDVTSEVSVLPEISLVSYTFSWSGTSPVGVLRVQVSNDYALDARGEVSSEGNWANISFLTGISFAASVAVSGNTGTANIILPPCGAYAFRTVYTRTSGTGTLQAWICGKAS